MAALQDHAAKLRDTTGHLLLAARTLAGDRVEQERIDAIQPGDTPRLVVFADQSGQTNSQAGGPPRFVVTCNLTIQALVQHAKLADVLRDLDTLTAQVKLALLCDPAWVILASNIATLRVTSAYKPGGDYITGDARIQITTSWFEQYDPNLTTRLSGVDLQTAISQGETIVSQFIPGVS